MVEVGGQPILWHIMNIYASHGFDDFLVACGYKGEMIKEYFHGLAMRYSDYVIDLKNGAIEVLGRRPPEWRVAVVDTGINTMTGGRILRLRDLINSAPFMVTYGDGVGNIDLKQLLAFHRSHGRLATVTAVRPPARFGGLALNGDRVTEFTEKPQTIDGWINGGFFVFEPAVLDLIDGDQTILEIEPLEQLATSGQLMAYRHHGFWQPMDTLRERQMLEDAWNGGIAPWKTW